MKSINPIYFLVSSQDESMDTSSQNFQDHGPDDSNPHNKRFKVDAKFRKLLVKVRLDMEEEFESGNKKRSALWDEILEKLKDKHPNLNLSKEQVNRKYLNLLCTYKRIKHRHKESGKNSTTWELFDDFDNVYGSSFFEKERMGTLLNEMKDESCDDWPESFINSTKNRKYINDILDYLEEEAVREQKRHQEILAIGEKKLQVDEKEIKAVLELKYLLEKSIDK